MRVISSIPKPPWRFPTNSGIRFRLNLRWGLLISIASETRITGGSPGSLPMRTHSPEGSKICRRKTFFDALIEQDRFDAINLREDTTLFDSYSGRHNLIAGFLQTDLPLLRELRLVAGVRVEHSTLSTKSQNPFSQGKRSKVRSNAPIPYPLPRLYIT